MKLKNKKTELEDIYAKGLKQRWLNGLNYVASKLSGEAKEKGTYAKHMLFFILN